MAAARYGHGDLRSGCALRLRSQSVSAAWSSLSLVAAAAALLEIWSGCAGSFRDLRRKLASVVRLLVLPAAPAATPSAGGRQRLR